MPLSRWDRTAAWPCTDLHDPEAGKRLVPRKQRNNPATSKTKEVRANCGKHPKLRKLFSLIHQ